MCALAASGLLGAPGVASAAETPTFLLAPATAAPPAPKLGVLYSLNLRLPEGRGLARLLLDSGVDAEDAAAAARLAAGHLGDGLGGCDVKVEISRPIEGRGFKLERAVVLTAASQTVIERRRGELTVASEAATRQFPRLV